MKRLFLFVAIISSIFILTSCSSNTLEMQRQIDDLTNKVNALEEEKSKLIAENSELKTFKENVESKEKEAAEEKRAEIKASEDEKSRLKNVVFNENNIVDGYGEFIVKSADFKQKVMPPNPDSFYTYYEVKDPKEIFLDVIIEFKNTSTISIKASDITNVKIIYGNGYEYRAMSTIEESGGGDFTYTNITSIEPLKYGTLHYLAYLPIEAKDSSEPVKAQFTIYGSNYEIVIR